MLKSKNILQYVLLSTIIFCIFAVSTGCTGADADKKDIEKIVLKSVSCTKAQVEKFNDFVKADGENKEGSATYVATDLIKHKVVPLGFNTFLHSTGGKVLPYGFAAYAWGHTAYSIFCTDPIARANQRGYGLR